MEVTRRDLFKFTGLAAAGVVGASALAGCAPKTAAETAALADTGSADAGLPAFLQAPEPITDFADTREYDVVVVGAGESGLSAAHSAVAAGAKVACVQNIGTAQTTGNMGASVDTTKTDEAGIQACVAFLMEKKMPTARTASCWKRGPATPTRPLPGGRTRRPRAAPSRSPTIPSASTTATPTTCTRTPTTTWKAPTTTRPWPSAIR